MLKKALEPQEFSCSQTLVVAELEVSKRRLYVMKATREISESGMF